MNVRIWDQWSRLPERTRKVVLFGLPGGLLCALLLVWVVWLPVVAKHRIEERLARSGLHLHEADVRVGLSSVSIRDLEIRDAQGSSRLLRAEHVEVEATLWGRRVESVNVEGANLEVTAAQLKQLLQRRGKRAEATPEGGAGRLPTVRWSRCTAVLKDEQGPLFAARDASGQFASGELEAAAAVTTLGSLPGESLELRASTVNGKLESGRPSLSQVQVGSATLKVSSQAREGTRGSAMAKALTLRRLLAVRDALRGAGEGTSQEQAASSRFTKGARIVLKDLTVVDVAADSAQTLISGLSMQATMQAPRAWLLVGQGKVQSEGGQHGDLAWDLKVMLDQAKVEGRVKLDEVGLSLFAPVLPPLPFHALERARVRADLEISGNGLASAAVKGDLSIRDLMFSSPRLAETEVGPISVSMHGSALWTPIRRELSDMKVEFAVGKTKTLVTGVLAWPSDGYRVDVAAQLQKAPCRDVLAAVPAGLLGELSSVDFGGDLAAKLTVHVDAQALDDTKVDFDIEDKCKFGAVPELLDLRRFERPFLHQVFEPDGTTFEMETGPGSAAWTPIELISPFMTQAAIAHEDGRFLSHHGFAEPEIGNALARNLKARAFRFGASTITMQLVKNLFLHRDKLLSRKVQEAFIVWWVEQQWDKRRILELYLNVIEYGPELYGIRNAALHYFGTTPLNLTPAQTAFLACILPNPKLYHDQYEKRALSDSMKKRIAAFLNHMHGRQRIDDQALAFGLEELNNFKFYDPSQPPGMPMGSMGTATPLPFIRSGLGFDPWGTVNIPEEDGSFGQ